METGTGRVSFYDPEGNYGFIEPEDGSPDVVFQLNPGDPPVAVGDLVGYVLIPRPEVTPRGREALRIWKVGFAPLAA